MPRRVEAVAIADPEHGRGDEQSRFVERTGYRCDPDRGEPTEPAWQAVVPREQSDRAERPSESEHAQTLANPSYTRSMLRRLLLALCVAALVPTGTAAAKTPLPGVRSPSGNI